MAKKKQLFIKNGIVFDPNIEDDPFGFDHEINLVNRKKYLKGKIKRKRYFGI